MKTQLRKWISISTFLFITLFSTLSVLDSAETHKFGVLLLLNTNLLKLNETAVGTNSTSTNIDLITLSNEDKLVANEPNKSKSSELFKRRTVTQAKEDLANRLLVEIDQIKLLEVRKVTWPDSSLGCPQSKEVYNQEPHDGLLVRLGIEGRMYFYHCGETQSPFLCEETSQVVPKVTPKHNEFIPPPDHEID